ncbi:hypothetical protein [Pseudomonas sp. SWRI154]|uniref:hypothetical protein n=1 Tax=Pseudomonas sp. SWRI154 TaxID=2745501 RepID=UPI0016477508|nr:hypothetical protein [Pseudomonas sp. SWRI154]MBC3366282.1 hypothetical protein [Pseudomonas sp. SWRI154]
MANRTLNDGSDGTVVISPGPTASGGGFQVGSGGFSGGFGGSGSSRSRRRRKARARARYEQLKAQQEAQAKADAEKAKATAAAQEQARLQARQHLLATMVQRYTNTRAEVDRNFAGKRQQLDASLQKDIAAAKRPPVSNSTERWQLYTITKEKNEIDGLIARKTTELNAKNSAARVFDGQDPLIRSANDYRTRLAQFGAALEEGHRLWEQAYTAAQEAQLLSAQIKALTEKSNALARHHAEQTVVWREREVVQERQRQYAEQRAERIRFKQQVDESTRLERFRQVHTLSVPALSMTGGGMVLSQGTVFVPRQDTAVLDKAVQSAVAMLGELKSIALKGPGLCAPGKAWSPGTDGASRHEMA